MPLSTAAPSLMSTSLRSLSDGGPSLWAPTETAPLDGLRGLQKRALEQLERRHLENFCERLHSSSMDRLFSPLCMDQMVTCGISLCCSSLEGTGEWLREIMGEMCQCVESSCCNGAPGDLEATLGSFEYLFSPM